MTCYPCPIPARLAMLVGLLALQLAPMAPTWAQAPANGQQEPVKSHRNRIVATPDVQPALWANGDSVDLQTLAVVLPDAALLDSLDLRMVGVEPDTYVEVALEKKPGKAHSRPFAANLQGELQLTLQTGFGKRGGTVRLSFTDMDGKRRQWPLQVTVAR